MRLPGLPAVWRLIAGRVVAALVTLLVASVMIFAAVEVLPGDAATAALGREATPEAEAQLRERLGLDRPPLVRYGEWIGGFVQGDLGRSLVNEVPVTQLIGSRLANTGILLLVTMAVLIPLSVVLGTFAALRKGSRADTAIQVTTLAVQSLPEFVLGLGLILGFAVFWPLLPAVSLEVTLESLVLPAATLVLIALAYTSRFVRAGIVDILGSDYVAMARLKGLSERKVIRRHVLPNALGPFAHALAITVAWLSGGVVIVEVLFGFPGVGQGLVDAVSSRDAPTIEAFTLILAAGYIVANLAADLFTILTTPRLRMRL